MSPNATASANHDALFPGRVSTLAQTDPELIEVFDNFAFDEVLAHEDLDQQVRLLCQLAAMIAAQALAEFRVMTGAALTAGVTPVQVKEVVYQAVPYVGMAKVFDFLHAVNDVLTEHGVELPLPGQSASTPETRHAVGAEVRRRIVGQFDETYAGVREDERHLQRYLTGNCFGDHVSRDGLDLRTRELLTFSMLAALGGCESQLAGHVAGNLNVGNDRATLLAVLTQLVPFIGYPRTLNALRVLDEGTLEK